MISYLPNDLKDSLINCPTIKHTWKNLIVSHEGPSDTKENMIMDLKLQYQPFRANEHVSLSQTYTR